MLMRSVTTVLNKSETIGSEKPNFPDHLTQQDRYSALLAWRRRQHLIFVGYSEVEILRLGNLAKLTSERMNELMHSKLLHLV